MANEHSNAPDRADGFTAYLNDDSISDWILQGFVPRDIVDFRCGVKCLEDKLVVLGANDSPIHLPPIPLPSVLPPHSHDESIHYLPSRTHP